MVTKFCTQLHLVHPCYSGSKLAPDQSNQSYGTLILSELLYFVSFMLEHPQLSISHKQNRAKLVRQSTVFGSERLQLSDLELKKKLP